MEDDILDDGSKVNLMTIANIASNPKLILMMRPKMYFYLGNEVTIAGSLMIGDGLYYKIKEDNCYSNYPVEFIKTN